MSFVLGNNPVPSIDEYITIELEDGDKLDIMVTEVNYEGNDIVIYFSYDRRQEELDEEVSNQEYWEMEFNRFECGVDYDY